jgi:hypothetical protein
MYEIYVKERPPHDWRCARCVRERDRDRRHRRDRRPLLPVLPLVDAALLGYLLSFFPSVLATAPMALGTRQSVRFALLAAAVTGLVVVTLRWAGWIGLIVNECVLQDNRCFD